MHRDDGRYALTDWGRGLHEAIYALGRWAGPLMLKRGKAEFQPGWLRHMVIARFEGADPQRDDLVVEMRLPDAEPMTLVSSRGRVHLVHGGAALADVVLTGPPDGVAGLLGGRVGAAGARRRGVSIAGDAKLLRGLRPRTGYAVTYRS